MTEVYIHRNQSGSAPGAALTQSGDAAPVEDVELSRGWNWIGHAPLISYGINSGVTTIGAEFTARLGTQISLGSMILCVLIRR